jgi:5-methylcytosine-specific restriction endonuclease McrA
VLPRSQGGKTSWENVVCSCVPCNLRKGGRTPEQARMHLLKKPVRPRWTPLFRGAARRVTYREWLPFLTLAEASYWNVELLDE